MIYLIIFLLTLFCISDAMDTKAQLRKQLRDITFNGNDNAFKQHSKTFAQELDANDILHAKQQCDARLLALESLKTMYTKTHIKDLFFAMQAEMKTSKMGLFAYIDAEGTKAKYNSTPEKKEIFDAAASILWSIELRKTSFTGNYLVDLQEKLIGKKKPVKFITKEIVNTTHLQNALQHILESKETR